MARTTVITCDGCGDPVPGNDDARYTLHLTCMDGPNLTNPTFGEQTADLCGLCAALVRHIIMAHGRGEPRPVAVEFYTSVEGAVT